MADVTIGGINLDITGQFQAAYIPTPPEELPAGCELPPFTPPPSLPDAVVLPPTTCSTQFPPIIPIPEVCIPSFAGGFTVNACPNPKNSATVDGELQFESVGCCGYALTGALEVCVPCIPKFTNNVSVVGVCAGVTVNDPIHLEPVDVDSEGNVCVWDLRGDIEIAIPIVTTNLTITTYDCTGTDPDIVNVIGINQPTAITVIPIMSGSNICEWHLQGEVEFCAPVKCPGGYTVVNNTTVTDTATGSILNDPFNLSFATGCSMVYSGNMNVFCPSGISFIVGSFPINITLPDGNVASSNVSMHVVRDAGTCNFSITGAIDITLPGGVLAATICNNGNPETVQLWKFE